MDSPELPIDLSSVQFQEEVLRSAIRNMRRAEKEQDIKPREKAALATSVTQAIRNLSRLRGEGDLTGAQIVRSRKFREIMVAIADALSSFGRPEILEAIVARLERIEASA
jgi:hypothetical protein